VKLARHHLERLAETLSVRRVYADLDGTLLGPGGSLFAHPEGVTGEPAAALVALEQAGIGLVPVSGRTQDQVRETARALGADAYVAEIGGLVVHRDGGREVVTRNQGSMTGRGTPYEAILRQGAAGLLLDIYAGRLEPHTPWAFLPRECSVLLRGEVPVDEVNQTLDRSGNGWLELLDNGIIAAEPGRFPGLALERVHAYHLVPKGVSKTSAVALDRARLALSPEACIAVGDSASDAAVAPEVGAVFLVANGEAAVDGLVLADNVYLMDRSHGLGFADAVRPFIPGHRDP
jgi:hydroxymethylpyrimidine pyrophosphatase-like HAD family hydrolase